MSMLQLILDMIWLMDMMTVLFFFAVEMKGALQQYTYVSATR